MENASGPTHQAQTARVAPAAEPWLADRPYTVGAWRVEPSTRRLICAGQEEQLEPKILAVLSCLAAHAGQVTSRTQLLAAGWPDVHVTEDPLNRAISTLRRIFEDDPRQPRYIETIPKRGYRLLATVRTETTAAPERLARTPRDGKALRWAGLVGGLGLLLTVLVLLAPSDDDPQLVRRVSGRIVPVTSFPGRELHPALSPGGSRVAFAWLGEDGDNLDIYVKQVGEDSLLRLTFDPAFDGLPSWSPDGSRLAFTRSLVAQREIWAVAALGGPARRLYTAHSTAASGHDWSPDGARLAVSDVPPGTAAAAIMLVEIDGGLSHPLTHPKPGHEDTSPRFAPDGRRVAFRRRFGDARYDILSTKLDGSDLKRHTFDQQDLGGFDWLPDSSGFVVSSNRQGSFELWQVDLKGAFDRLGLDRSFSPDVTAKHLVFARRQHDIDVWRVPLSGELVAGRQPEPLLDSTLSDLNPQYAPDGEQIAFVSLRSGSFEIWLSDAAGNRPQQLTHRGGPAPAWLPSVRRPRWSPDGRELLFCARDDDGFDLLAVELASGEVSTVVRWPGDECQAEVLGGGTTVVLVAERDGRPRLWQVDRHTDAATPLVDVDAQALVAVGPDDRIYFTGGASLGLWRMRIDGREEPELVVPDVAPYELASGPRGIYLLTGKPTGHLELAFFDPTTARVTWRRLLPNLRPAGRSMIFSGGLAISPDSRWFLYARAEDHESDLYLATWSVD